MREMHAFLPRLISGGSILIDNTDMFRGEVRRRLGDLAAEVRHTAHQTILETAGAITGESA